MFMSCLPMLYVEEELQQHRMRVRNIIGGVFTGDPIKLLAVKVTQRQETI